jgi:hypothetical protein
MQADGDLYRDEAIDKTLLIVTANHLVTALNRCSTSGLGVPKLPTDLRTAIEHLRDIYKHWESYYRRTAARPFAQREVQEVASGAAWR